MSRDGLNGMKRRNKNVGNAQYADSPHKRGCGVCARL